MATPTNGFTVKSHFDGKDASVRELLNFGFSLLAALFLKAKISFRLFDSPQPPPL